MNDFTDREIKIGDIVAFHSSGYKSLFKGYVYNIGEKMLLKKSYYGIFTQRNDKAKKNMQMELDYLNKDILL